MIFQAEAPMIHIVHDKQTRLLREFLGYFIKPEKLPKGSKKLMTLNLDAKENWSPSAEMFMGAVSRKIVLKSNSKDCTVKDVMERLQLAYEKCGKMLQKKMPVNNQLLKTLSAIDQSSLDHSLTLKYLLDLPTQMTNVFTEDEQTKYEKEVHWYNSEPTNFEINMRIDHWWAAVETYPHLLKVILEALTCFQGPMVEGAWRCSGCQGMQTWYRVVEFHTDF